MDRNRVTVRYAKALIELASEQNVLDEVNRDMQVLFTALSDYNGFNDFVIIPGDTSSEKLAKVESIFASQFHPLSMKFLKLVFTNNREEYLKDLCRNIIEMTRKLKGIVSANLIVASPINDKSVDKIKAKFEQQLDATVEMTSETDPKLIGGFVFTIDGQQYDASVASRLNKIKKQLQLK